MMAAKVESTNNFRMFELLDTNRDAIKIKALMESMKKHGWIDSKPMSVFRNGSNKLKIRDGHHRFEVAQRLGIAVKYVVDSDEATIYELDKTTNKWTLTDCITSFCRSGKIEYLKVKQYCDDTGISLSLAASMLMGQCAGSGNYHAAFRIGSYKVNHNSQHANIVKELVLCCKRAGVTFYNTNLLVMAFSKIAFVDQFDLDHMKSKIRLFPTLFEKKANLDQYLMLVEDIYNRQSRKKIPLKYLSIEKSREREQIVLNKRT
jgi:hypothetical protein